jgi:hypothetical protein
VGCTHLTKYYCPKCDKKLSKPEVEKILCLNCGKLTHIDTQSTKSMKPENAKKRKQKYILISAIVAGSLIVGVIVLYNYTNTQFYQYSMECKKFVDNQTTSVLDANLTLTQSEIEGSTTQDCIAYGNDTYCYQVGMNNAPKSTDPNWSCDVLSVTQVSNYTAGSIASDTVPP